MLAGGLRCGFPLRLKECGKGGREMTRLLVSWEVFHKISKKDGKRTVGVAASHPMPCLAKLELGSLGLSLGGCFPSAACEPSRC